MGYDYILFDLDGTLTDSAAGITQSVAYALEKFGITDYDYNLLKQFVGPPLTDSFKNLAGIPEDQVGEAIRIFRSDYANGKVFVNKPYDGLQDFLANLKSHDKTTMVATSKPMPMAEKVLNHFDLKQYFDAVFAGTMAVDNNACNKSLIVSNAIKACGDNANGNILMVGDRKHDVIGAHDNNIPCAGVLWGYGSVDELQSENVEYLVKDWDELLNLILAE